MPQRHARPLHLLAAVLALCATGCPWTSHVVDTAYAPTRHDGAPKIGAKVRFTVEVLRPPVGRKGVVGTKRTGYGSDSADVRTSPPSGEWFEAALRAELMHHGAMVVEQDDPEALQLRVTLEQLFIEPEMGAAGFNFVAAAIVTAEIDMPDAGLRFRRRFVGVEEITSTFMWGAVFDELLPAATENVLKQLMEGIADIIITTKART